MAAIGVAAPGEQVVGRLEPGELGLEVGDDLGALGPVELADRLEAVLGLVEQALEGVAPAAGVGLEQPS